MIAIDTLPNLFAHLPSLNFVQFVVLSRVLVEFHTCPHSQSRRFRGRCFEIISHFNYLLKFSPVVPDEAQLMDLITRICVMSCGLYNWILQPWNGYIESMTELRLAAKHKTIAGSEGERDVGMLNWICKKRKTYLFPFRDMDKQTKSTMGLLVFAFGANRGFISWKYASKYCATSCYCYRWLCLSSSNWTTHTHTQSHTHLYIHCVCGAVAYWFRWRPHTRGVCAIFAFWHLRTERSRQNK